MEILGAIGTFAALGNETRLRAFKYLVQAGKAGMTAGNIARALEVPPSTLTTHLGTLVQAGLIQSWRSERNIFYAIRAEGIRDLVHYLTSDCCQGRPELCGLENGEASSRAADEKSG